MFLEAESTCDENALMTFESINFGFETAYDMISALHDQLDAIRCIPNPLGICEFVLNLSTAVVVANMAWVKAVSVMLPKYDALYVLKILASH